MCRAVEYNSLKDVDVDKMLSSTSAMSQEPGSSKLNQAIELPSLLSRHQLTADFYGDFQENNGIVE